MEFHDLEVFVSVAREKSFSRAAKTVFRTQPAVSLAVRRLEDEFGERLFDRSNKEPALTYEGELLMEYAEQLLNLRKEIGPALSDLRTLQRGRVRIGANESGALFLLPYISQYSLQYPDVKVEIVRTYARDLPQELLKRNLDLGILSYVPEEPNLIATPLMDDNLSFVVYPKHPLAKQRSVSIRSLKDERFAVHNVRSFYRDQVTLLFQKHRVSFRIDIELPTVESIKRYVEKGRAVGIISRLCLSDELARGSLVEVKVKELKIRRKLYLVSRRNDPLSHVPRAFFRMMTASDAKA